MSVVDNDYLDICVTGILFVFQEIALLEIKYIINFNFC